MKRNILLLFTFFACITVQGQTPVRLVDLRSEHLDRPIGLDNPVPRLSWRMEDGRQGAVQTSWRIVVDEDSLNVVNGCERAAVCAADGPLQVPKQAGGGVTVAAAVRDWKVKL